MDFAPCKVESFTCNLEIFSFKRLSLAFLQMYCGLILIIYPAEAAKVSSRNTKLYLDQFVYDLYLKNWPNTGFPQLTSVRIIISMILPHSFICHRGSNILPIYSIFKYTD